MQAAIVRTPQAPHTPSRFSLLIRDLRQAIRAGILARRRVAELRSLDTRELADLGISSSDSDAIARGTYTR